jgi:hypothetical protein
MPRRFRADIPEIMGMLAPLQPMLPAQRAPFLPYILACIERVYQASRRVSNVEPRATRPALTPLEKTA